MKKMKNKKFVSALLALTFTFSGTGIVKTNNSGSGLNNVFGLQDVNAQPWFFYDDYGMFFGDMFYGNYLTEEENAQIVANNQLVIDDVLSKLIKDGFSEEQKVKAIYDFLIYQFMHTGNSDETPCPDSKKISYNTDLLTVVDNGTSLLKYGYGVCDNFAALFTLLLDNAGIESIVAVGNYLNRSGSVMPHAWNAAKIDGVWYWFDVDVEGSVYRRGDVTVGEPIYFLYKKDTEYWRTNHSWDENYYTALFNEIDSTPKQETVQEQEIVVTNPEPSANTSATKEAKSTSSSVLINAVDTPFDAYNIDGNNYFKLRDLAYALNGSNKKFEVTWDNDKQAINILSNTPYTSVGGEMSLPSGAIKNAKTGTSKIFLNGTEVDITAYNIDDNNYFKLRDICKILDIGVNWDGTTDTISIYTAASYKD